MEVCAVIIAVLLRNRVLALRATVARTANFPTVITIAVIKERVRLKIAGLFVRVCQGLRGKNVNRIPAQIFVKMEVIIV